MSRIKALEKLREWASQHKGWSYYDVEINEIADEIETELKANDSTHWHELFGTPERAARTLFEIKCGEKSCKGCPIAEPCAECDVMLDDGKALHDALLEWLKEDS